MDLLRSLERRGASRTHMLENGALGYLQENGAVILAERSPFGGPAHRHIDFYSKELTIACLHLIAIDFGDAMTLADALVLSIESVDGIGYNQFALLRMESADALNEAGREKRIPAVWRVHSSARILRKEDVRKSFFAGGRN